MHDQRTVPLPFQPVGAPDADVVTVPFAEAIATLRTWVSVTLREHLHGAAGTDWDPEHPDSIDFHEVVDDRVDDLDADLRSLHRWLAGQFPDEIPEPQAEDAAIAYGPLATLVGPQAAGIIVRDVVAGRDLTVTQVSHHGGTNVVGGLTRVFHGSPGDNT